MTKKSLCVVTGTRAEYGLLRPVLQKLLQSAVIEPRLVVTGAHLAPEFGNTVSEIEADGMPIAAHPRFRRDAGRGAGTVRLGLFSRMDGEGINGTPRGGGPVKGSMRGLLPEAIHRY